MIQSLTVSFIFTTLHRCLAAQLLAAQLSFWQVKRRKRAKGVGWPAELTWLLVSFLQSPTAILCLYLIGQNWITWSFLAAREAGKCFLAGHTATLSETRMSFRSITITSQNLLLLEKIMDGGLPMAAEVKYSRKSEPGYQFRGWLESMKAKFFEEYLKTKEIFSWRKLRGHRTAGFKHLKLSKGKKLRLDLRAQG